MGKNAYFSPLFLAAQLIVDDDPTIIIGASQDTGGIGPGCFEETAMLSGMPGAEVYFLHDDGTKTLVGYHQVRVDAEDYDEYYDINKEWIDLAEYNFDFEEYVGLTYDLWCDYGMGGL